MRNAEDAKSRESLPVEPQLQRLENPLPINALSTLRDGVPCSDTMGCGRYVGFRGARVKGPAAAQQADITRFAEIFGAF